VMIVLLAGLLSGPATGNAPSPSPTPVRTRTP
jgi:hypothetical protein